MIAYLCREWLTYLLELIYHVQIARARSLSDSVVSFEAWSCFFDPARKRSPSLPHMEVGLWGTARLAGNDPCDEGWPHFAHNTAPPPVGLFTCQFEYNFWPCCCWMKGTEVLARSHRVLLIACGINIHFWEYLVRSIIVWSWSSQWFLRV